jgi:hypothetical protein
VLDVAEEALDEARARLRPREVEGAGVAEGEVRLAHPAARGFRAAEGAGGELGEAAEAVDPFRLVGGKTVGGAPPA